VLSEAVARLVEAILDGKGATSVQARHAAFADGAENAAVARDVDLVRRHA
jgi:hypothetical protein